MARLPDVFRTVRLRLQIGDTDHFAQYIGATPADVRRHYESKRSLFSWAHLFGSVGSARQPDVRLSAFNQTCVGIETAQSYTVRLHVIRFDLLRAGMFAVGTALFCTAHRLTKMPFFYYTSGVGLGVTLSVFLVVWLIARQLPKRSMMVGTIVGGWTLLWYCMQAAWENGRSLVMEHQMYVFYYVATAALVSFVACYRIGPPTNERSVDIVRWVLQAGGAALIWTSSEWTEMMVAVVLTLLWLCYVGAAPLRWLGRFRWIGGVSNLRILTNEKDNFSHHFFCPSMQIWRWCFPPKRRLLTVEEFEEQARENTRCELEKMMQWCGSPAAKPWQQVSRLRDPKRFAEFIERGVHLTDEERFDHTQSLLEDDCMIDTSDEDTEEVDVATATSGRRATTVTAAAPEISDDEDDEAAEMTPPPIGGWRLSSPTSHSNGSVRNNSSNRRVAENIADISSDDE